MSESSRIDEKEFEIYEMPMTDIFTIASCTLVTRSVPDSSDSVL